MCNTKNINLNVLDCKLANMGIFRACSKIQMLLDDAIKQGDLSLVLYLLNELEIYVPKNISKYIFYEQSIATAFDQAIKQNHMLEYKFIAASNSIRSNIASLRDMYKDRECVILGNASTAPLTQEETCGRCIIGCLPVYEDCNGQPLIPDLCVGLPGALPEASVPGQVSNTAYVLPLGAYGSAYSGSRVYFVNMLPSPRNNHTAPLFSIALERRAWIGSGPAYLALQLACYLGCRELRMHCSLPKAELNRAMVALNHCRTFYSVTLPRGYTYANEKEANRVDMVHAGSNAEAEASPPDISIIVPCYNSQATLDRCIGSLVNQRANVEIIIVNDGSTDATADVAQRWAAAYPVKIINQANQGCGLARNCGLKAVTGRYVTFVDSDDYLDVGVLEKCLWELGHRPVDILLFGMKRIHDGKQIAQTENFALQTGMESLRIMANKEPLAAWGRIYSRKLIMNNDIRFGVGTHEDLVFTLQCYYYAKCCSALPIYGYNWVTRVDSIMDSYSPKYLHYIEHHMKGIRDFLQRNSIYREYFTMYENFAYRYFSDVYSRCKSHNFTDQNLIKECNSIITRSIKKYDQIS